MPAFSAATQSLGREEYGAGTEPKEREWQPYMSTIRRIHIEEQRAQTGVGRFQLRAQAHFHFI